MERKNTRIEDGVWKGMDGWQEGKKVGRTDGQTDTVMDIKTQIGRKNKKAYQQSFPH